MNRLISDINFDSSFMKRICRSVTCLLDLPNEILLMICHYLSPAHAFYSFYTPEKPQLRLHHLMFDYYTKIKLDQITNNEYCYLLGLLSDSKTHLQLESLILSNKHITCSIQRYFSPMFPGLIESTFGNLRPLSLINCSIKDIASLCMYDRNLIKLEYLHITVREFNEDTDSNYLSTCNLNINQLIFNQQIYSLHTISIEVNEGLILNKSLTSHQILRNVNLILETIDDLYTLLDGLVPNVQTMIIQLCQTRLLKIIVCCHQLTQFTLLDCAVQLVTDDMKCVFGFTPNLIKLTLSIRDTSDAIFCHGPKLESILSEYLPHLHQFDYTMIHRINARTLIEDFIQWPMNSVFYKNENCKWIHIYSLPWPSNKDDKRRVPIVKAEYMDHVIITKSKEFIELKTSFRRASELTTCLSIDIKLPERICKIILTRDIPRSSNTSLIQPTVRHLIVQCHLKDEREISNLGRQFPNTLFSIDIKDSNNRQFWPKLINFSTKYFNFDLNQSLENDFHRWLIENTDLKLMKSPFYAIRFNSILSIWF